eukprot:gene7678-13501_t
MPTSLRVNNAVFLSIAIKSFVSDTKTRSDYGDKWDRVSELPVGGLTLNYHYDNVLPSKPASGNDSYKRSISLPASPKSRRKFSSTDSPQNKATNLLEVKEKSPTDFYSQAEDRRSAPSSVTTTPVASRRTPVKARDTMNIEEEYKKRQDGKDLLNLVVIGHVDAGKSTLMGHILFRLGNVTKKAMHKPASPKSRRKFSSTDSPQNKATNLLEVKEKSPTDFYSQAEDRRSAPSSVTTTPVASRRTPVKARDTMNIEEEYKKRQDGKDLLNLVVIGHVDAGKSTLMGHILFRLGNVTKKAMHKYPFVKSICSGVSVNRMKLIYMKAKKNNQGLGACKVNVV